ncbi:unnamed protein product [Adineta ricciae]|uniref:Uncharacterized protein n=1 Tax=Adineta ricciae TaxID=249248 RepID=A0A813ZV66_ADIRI|nr:unnamed protein product [Adineta ricciae]
MTENFPLLNEIDNELNSDNIDWNKNAFQTLLTSNLPMTTVYYYAIDVGLRRLESSLYEAYWDVTIDALNDLSQFLFHILSTDDINSYLYEAKCQLLLYASIAIIKLHTIRRRSINEARMACAAMSLLLLEQSQPYEPPSIKNQYSSCMRSMRLRYFRRTLMIGHWLPTLSQSQLNGIQLNHERYIETITENLFTSVSLRDKINEFIDDVLLKSDNDEDDLQDANGFVIIRRFPKYNEKTIEKYNDLMHLAFVHTLNQLNKDPTEKLVYCVWILCCMIEVDRLSLGVFSNCIIGEHFPVEPIDFEQKPITIESLNERDIIVFLLLCAQQNHHNHTENSLLHPYLLYCSSCLCTQQQKTWWQAALQRISSSKFIDHLATIRLDEEKCLQYPPKSILLQTAKYLFKAAQTAYEQHSNHSASSYEQYAIQYLQTAKAINKNHEAMILSQTSQTKNDKLFVFRSCQLSIDENNGSNDKLIKQCEKLARHCDELKLLPQPELPKMSSPIVESFYDENEDEKSTTIKSSIFVTPTADRADGGSDQTSEQILLLPPLPLIDSMQSIAETNETSTTTAAAASPPIVDVLVSHMNSVNQWINRFCVDNDGIQNDIQTIRDRLERLNRATSQMIFSNVKLFQSNPNANNDRHSPSES